MSIGISRSSSSGNSSGTDSDNGSSSYSSITTQDSAPLTLYDNLEKEIGKYEHRDVDIQKFVYWVWGLDKKDSERILAMSPTMDESLLAAYRECSHEDDLHAPFLAIAEYLLGRASEELKSECGGVTMHAFWDRLSVKKDEDSEHDDEEEDHFPDLIGLWKPVPPDGETPSLAVAKHIVEFKRLPRIRKTRRMSTSADSDASGSGTSDSSASNCLADNPTSPSGEPGSNSAHKRSFDSVKDADDPEGSDPKKPRLANHSPLKNSLMALYASEAMSSTCRTYVTGLVIDRFDITLCYFDRLLVATSATFSFEREPEVLALVLYAMSQCDRQHAGFDPHLHPIPLCATDSRTEIPAVALALPVQQAVGSFFEYPCSSDERGDFTFQVGSSCCAHVAGIIRKPQDLLSRGTTVYKVRRHLPDGTLSDDVYAFKLSWPPKHRTSEIDVVKYLKEKLPETCHIHLPDHFFTATFSPEQLDLPWLHLGLDLNADNHHNRVLRGMMARMYCKLWEVGSIENFKQVWLDCLELIHLAYKLGKVLHRDLSEHNLMAFKLGDGAVKGVLNDWDMSKFLDKEDDPLSRAENRIGTPPFMAIGLLMPKRPAQHWFRQELESMFYILIWAALHYNLKTGKRDKFVHESVAQWVGSMHDNLSSKMAICTPGREGVHFLYEGVKPEFKGLVEEWIEPLRELFIFARYDYSKTKKSDGQSDDSTYDGRITFKTFMKAINVTPRTWGIPNFLDDDA
ncbi:hypothetical protein NMY22_g15761 [Coprinellus aureogranulatus]|nr:hypothetical protein NMY22_g15761 [Coprinellus aureogranulatus]